MDTISECLRLDPPGPDRVSDHSRDSRTLSFPDEQSLPGRIAEIEGRRTSKAWVDALSGGSTRRCLGSVVIRFSGVVARLEAEERRLERAS